MNIKVIKKIEILNSDLKSYFENTSLIFFFICFTIHCSYR